MSSVTYDEVVSAAQSILKGGERYSVEKIQKNLGKGTAQEISEQLKQWQINKNQRRNKNRNPNQNAQGGKNTPHQGNRPKHQAKRQNKRFQKRDQRDVSVGHKFPHYEQDFTETYRQKEPSEPFSVARLQKESGLIQALFWALLEVKQKRAEAIDFHQRQNSEVYVSQLESDQKVIKIKKKARIQINDLYYDLNKIQTLKEKELIELRNSL